MEPQIRYAKTSDGVSIAWHAMGSGPAYVWPATTQTGGIIENWRVPEFRNLLEEIARHSTLIVYDPRGFGVSDRNATDFSLDAAVRDLEAVVDAAAPGRFTLQTFSYVAMPALAYAAQHPERVRALILLNGVMRGADLSESWRRLLARAGEDWEYATALLARTNEASYASTATLEQIHQALMRGLDREAFIAFNQAMTEWDATPIASNVARPALVIHYGQSLYIPVDACRALAKALPDATFVSAEPDADEETRLGKVREAVFAFLRDVAARRDRPGPPEPLPDRAGTAIILFTDIADSAALTERMGDVAFRAASRRIDDGVRAAIRDAGGTPVTGKVLGDGVMGVFASATQAIQAARRCVEVSIELPLHIGIHAGDVIREDDNVYGGAVNIASRICALCEPGDILVSQTVRDLARTSAGVTFDDGGEHALKGIADRVRVFVVRTDPR